MDLKELKPGSTFGGFIELHRLWYSLALPEDFMKDKVTYDFSLTTFEYDPDKGFFIGKGESRDGISLVYGTLLPGNVELTNTYIKAIESRMPIWRGQEGYFKGALEDKILSGTYDTNNSSGVWSLSLEE